MIAGLKSIDKSRIIKVEIASQDAFKKAKQLKRSDERRREHVECLGKSEYGPRED